MYKLGHYGVAMGLFTPFATGLIAVGYVELAVLGWTVVVGISMVPDVDRTVPLLEHRGITHTVWFVLAGSLVIGIVAGIVDGSQLGFVFGCVVGATGLGSHLIADVLTPSGIRPFLPVINTKYTLSIVKARNPVANYVLLAAGSIIAATGVWIGYGM